MKKPNQRLLYLLPLLLTVAFIVFGEALGDLWKEDVKALFQQNKWLLLAFVLLLALVGFLWERQQRSEKNVPEEVDKDQYDEAFGKFKELLKEQYQIRLNSKTGRRLPINLTAKSTHFGTAPDRVQAYFKDKDLTIESENIAWEIDKILKTNDRLLLIGDPGAGKTTILLYAAINILNDRQSANRLYSSDDFESSDEVRALRSDDSKSSDRSDSKSPDRSKLPLIINLATWSEGRDFAEWYAQNIAHTYSLSPVFVRELLRHNAVVPFFDGFDEVVEEYRDDCFQKMAAYFGDRRERQLIVSSRKKEYAAAQADAPVYAQIEVQPLSLTQIKKALSENAQSQAADQALLHALDRDRWLAEAVETPFYLNTASFLFGKGERTLADFPFEADSTEGRQAELVEIFVAEQVPEKRDRKYLHFLAERMEQENFLVFELEDMQPDWRKKLWWYRLFLGLLVGLVGLVRWLGVDLFVALFMGLFAIVFGGLCLASESEITLGDIQIWSWSKFKKRWKRFLFAGLIIGLFAGSVIGLLMGLFADLIMGWGWGWGWNWGLIFGLFVGMIAGVRDAGTKISFLLHLLSPYQRFTATLRNYFWLVPTMILAGLASIFLIRIAFWIWKGAFWNKLPDVIQIQGLSLGWTGLCLGLSLLSPLVMSQYPQHFSLRLILYLEGTMPLRVVTFMDRMTDQLIFEDTRRSDKKGNKRRGATWRFRHKILQDYFARMGEVSSFEARNR